jgi:hypothetical protein
MHTPVLTSRIQQPALKSSDPPSTRETCVHDEDGSVIVFPERAAPREAGAGVRRWAWPQGTIITQMLMDGGSTDRHGATGGHSAPQGFGSS